MLLLTLLCLDRAGERGETVAYAGATVALAYMFRPTNAVAVVAVTAYVLFCYRPQFIRYLLFAAPFAVLFLGWNYMLYQSWVSSYGAVSRLGLHDQFIPAMIGNWVSPSRGLLIYCPLFLFSFIGFWEHRSIGLAKMIVLLIFGHWLVISLYRHWWAGHSYGPRFFSDMIPMFCYGLILYLKNNPLKKPLAKAGFIVLLGFGLFVHGNGGINMDAFHWNTVPADVDTQPSRLWDWRDPQFARIVSKR